MRTLNLNLRLALNLFLKVTVIMILDLVKYDELEMRLEDQDGKLRDTLNEIRNLTDSNSKELAKIESELSSLRAHFLKSQKTQWNNLMKEVDIKMNSIDLAPIHNKIIAVERDIKDEFDKFAKLKDVENCRQDLIQKI